MKNIELIRFRTELLQEVIDSIRTEETGGIREEKFTEFALEYLEEAGETEGALPCREIKENSIGNRIHKINAYALSEGYETIDLFITVFNGATDLSRLYADELKVAVNLATRFLRNVFTGKVGVTEETSPVFDFVQTIRKVRQDVVRVNISILSDVLIPFNPPLPSRLGELIVHYHIRDIEYLYRIHSSGSGREPIEIKFAENFGETIPCLSMPKENNDYESYLAIVPAHILADIYQDFGARLLEQNVRTFLQFRGKINKGIRDTILKEPHMFMAYNNGISATAGSVELTEDGNNIISVKDFQVVNGGQTTASIFQTRRKFKEADIDAVCVQLKLSVIRDLKKKTEIVSLISRYANTQNKVSEADLTSNHPFHIETENLSRKIWAPPQPGRSQTRWFYERARGQYNDELSKIDAAGQRRKWQERNPKNQKFAKEDLARFYNAWEMLPWWVVKGRQRNFIEFMKIADDLDTDIVFYEDLVAKAIIFRSAEKLYGVGAKAIGDLRYIVVPYTVAWLSLSTGGKINLHEIWRQQVLSESFRNLLSIILHKINAFMRNTAPGGLIGEWAKKEECWKKLREVNLNITLSAIDQDLYTEAEQFERYKTNAVMTEEQRFTIHSRIKIISAERWLKIGQWGKATGKLDMIQIGFIRKVTRRLERGQAFSDKELNRAGEILEVIISESPELIKAV